MLSSRQYIDDLMRDKRNDLISGVIKLILLLISYLYGFLVNLHHFFYKVKLLKSYKLPIPVFSVGNITLGGTGKTPFVIMLARYLARKNKKVAVLIRGYGEDEWKMLKYKLSAQGVEVFVGRNRIASAKEALQCGFDTIILDDGFQHRRLARDSDIVLIDSGNAFGNKRLFPRGILREPLRGLRRATCIVMTKIDKGEDNTLMIENEVDRFAPGKKILKAVHRPKCLFELDTKKTIEPGSIQARSVCIFSAICDPSYFRHTVEKIGGRIGIEFVFPDHYTYKKEDLDEIHERCKRKNIDTIITTEKDAVKLDKLLLPKNNFRILVLTIELAILEGEEKIDAILH